MKTKKYLAAIFGSILALLLILASCSSTKRSAVSCPEISSARYAKDTEIYTKKRNTAAPAYHGTDALRHHSGLLHKKKAENGHASKQQDDLINVNRAGEISSISKSEYSEALTASSGNSSFPKLRSNPGTNLNQSADSPVIATDFTGNQQAGCDTIILKSGSRIIGKVEEIGQSEIRYRRCDNITGPIISISKSGVNRILYVNGTREIMVSDSPIVVNNNQEKPIYSNTPPKTNALGLAGFIAGILGLFVAGIILGSVGVIFGGISFAKISREPGRYKGKGLSIAAIIIGVIAIAGAIYFMVAF
jgi:hypothetical protein